jgi:hypothetical protein
MTSGGRTATLGPRYLRLRSLPKRERGYADRGAHRTQRRVAGLGGTLLRR